MRYLAVWWQSDLGWWMGGVLVSSLAHLPRERLCAWPVLKLICYGSR